MLNILFIGDINGKIGRQTVKKILPDLKQELKPDLVIANAENIAHGHGVSEPTLKEMLAAGVNWFTGGNHSFGNTAYLSLYDSNLPLLRPANYADSAPGQGQTIIEINGHKILLINLIGQVYMGMYYDNPFIAADKILSNLASNNISAIIVDIHAQVTSEKLALFHYLDGRISAMIGTHTHIMTADAEISKAGTAYLTDVGQTGFADGILGMSKAGIIKTFLTQIKEPHDLPETGRAIFNAISLTIDPRTKRATAIKPITKHINIT